MEEILEILKNIEGILTFIAVAIALGTIALGFLAFMKYETFLYKKEETYKNYNLEFLDRRIKNEIDYTRRLFTDNACEISKLKDEIQTIKKKVGKK